MIAEALDAVVIVVCHVHLAQSVDCHAFWGVKLPVCASCDAPFHFEGSIIAEPLNTMVVSVGYVDLSRITYGDSIRLIKLPVAGAELAPGV